MNFDGFQREVLAELGLAVYALARTQAEDAPPSMPATRAQAVPASALLDALLRAAAADMGCNDVVALCREFLAANPNPSVPARRALWPRLRRLRARRA